MLTDILRYTAFTVFILVLLPYTVMAVWGIFAWTKALLTGDELPHEKGQSSEGKEA